MTTRREDLLAWLVSSRAVDEASDTLTAAIDDTQSSIGMELAWWHELDELLDLVEDHARVHVEELGDAP